MRRSCYLGGFVVAVSVTLSPAYACRDDDQRPALKDVKFADLVVAGRIANYVVVNKRDAKTSGSSGSDYARFDILINEVLRGSARNIVSATIDYPLYAELPFMRPGPYVIALRDPKSTPSAGYTSNPTPNLMTVLQEGCAPAFIFEANGNDAAELRTILGSTAK